MSQPIRFHDRQGTEGTDSILLGRALPRNESRSTPFSPGGTGAALDRQVGLVQYRFQHGLLSYGPESLRYEDGNKREDGSELFIHCAVGPLRPETCR
jgi:hypothetical protein